MFKLVYKIFHILNVFLNYFWWKPVFVEVLTH